MPLQPISTALPSMQMCAAFIATFSSKPRRCTEESEVATRNRLLSEPPRFAPPNGNGSLPGTRFWSLEEDYEFESESSTPMELDDTAKARDNEVDNELDTELGTRITDREFQMTAALSFHSPALQLLWAPRFASRRKRGLQGLRAGRIVFGETYGRGVGRALGVWANCENPYIWLSLWYWIRRQREKLAAYFSQGSQGNI
ncbi:hypothetical protein F5144DRAFT_249444 [Chaetomium tenue]|uniref:Uncharacterized protein n=1 Tax=Chaetomium tenue TaxID=1854479 RepID=A0ACB7PA66_9PEZI|nr:hypothetical protein F5144DRAFT_249444 [Chaetomium globosum]